MPKRLMIIAMALSTTSGIALAQTNTPPPPTTSPPTPSTSAPAATMGMRTADTATLAVRFVTVKPADLWHPSLSGRMSTTTSTISSREVQINVVFCLSSAARGKATNALKFRTTY